MHHRFQDTHAWFQTKSHWHVQVPTWVRQDPSCAHTRGSPRRRQYHRDTWRGTKYESDFWVDVVREMHRASSFTCQLEHSTWKRICIKVIWLYNFKQFWPNHSLTLLANHINGRRLRYQDCECTYNAGDWDRVVICRWAWDIGCNYYGESCWICKLARYFMDEMPNWPAHDHQINIIILYNKWWLFFECTRGGIQASRRSKYVRGQDWDALLSWFEKNIARQGCWGSKSLHSRADAKHDQLRFACLSYHCQGNGEDWVWVFQWTDGLRGYQEQGGKGRSLCYHTRRIVGS